MTSLIATRSYLVADSKPDDIIASAVGVITQMSLYLICRRKINTLLRNVYSRIYTHMKPVARQNTYPITILVMQRAYNARRSRWNATVLQGLQNDRDRRCEKSACNDKMPISSCERACDKVVCCKHRNLPKV